MGFRMDLKKQNNHLYYDFPNAYWSIDALSFSNFIDYDENGVKTSTPTVSFSLRAYPSRESKIKENDIITIEYANRTVKAQILKVPTTNVSIQEAPSLYKLID